MPKKPRPLIVIEALDAGGSQTQTNLLVRRLKKEGFIPHQYHFPQEDRATGQLIYEKFLFGRGKPPARRSPKGEVGFSKREQALLYIQDFYSRLDEMNAIAKKGKKKEVMVSDRYYTSTMAYQTIGLTGKRRQEMMDWLDWLCCRAGPSLLQPSVVIFLDTPVDVSLQHLSSKKKDYFETKEKLSAIRQSYLKLAQEQKWVVLDSMDSNGNQRTRKSLHDEIWEHAAPLA